MHVRLKGLNHVRKRLADGTFHDYYYAWKGGPRVHGDLGSPEFIANYNAAVASEERAPKDNLQSLVHDYLRSRAFSDLADATKATYKYHIGWIENEFGDLPLSALTERQTRRGFLDWRERIAAKSPRQADLAFGTLARIISWGVDRGIAPANPCQRAGRIYSGSRREKTWSGEQQTALLEKAPPPIRTAFLIALWTGQRQNDVLNLTWSAYDGEFIRLKQRKTGAEVAVPAFSDLKKDLDANLTKLRRNLAPEVIQTRTIVTTNEGRPWTGTGFRSVWRKVRAEAGVEGVTFHDLRGTAVTHLADAGCSVPEIASITGHSLRDAAEMLQKHYLNPNNALAISAIEKLEKAMKRPTRRPTAR